MNRAFLKGLGIEDEVINQILDEAGKDINSKKTEITNLRADLVKKDEEIETLKTNGSNANKLADKVKDLETKLSESQKENNEIRFGNMLEKAFTSANSIDNVSLKANLDLDAINKAEDKEKALNDQIEKLKTEKSHLFKIVEEPPTEPTEGEEGEGSTPNPYSYSPEGGGNPNNGFNFNFTGVRAREK